MKLVFIGGGAHRYLSVARSLLAEPSILWNGEINLYDPSVARAEAVGRMIMKTPEYANANCQVTWGTTLNEALDGASVVNVVLFAGSRMNFELSMRAASRHGFIASDQLSPSGAVLALKTGPILLDIARRMEKLCPNAWLVDFANPVAVMSAAINNHTRIRCLGVCAGYTNHQWDLTRLLYGRDEQLSDYVIYNAGVNHLSFILPGSTHRGIDLFELAERELRNPDWSVCSLSDRWDETTRTQIAGGITLLREYYLKYGQLVFSTEGDGMAHLDVAGHYVEQARAMKSRAVGPPDQQLAQDERSRHQSDLRFREWIQCDMSAADWDPVRPDALYLLRDDENVMVKVNKALAGEVAIPIVTSFPNRGAVKGFANRTVLEYSQILNANGLRPVGDLQIPAVFQEMVGALACHQTLLGDAIATQDPQVLSEALHAYPVMRDTPSFQAMWREQLEIAGDEIPAAFRATSPMLCRGRQRRRA